MSFSHSFSASSGFQKREKFPPQVKKKNIVVKKLCSGLAYLLPWLELNINLGMFSVLIQQYKKLKQNCSCNLCTEF